MLLANDIKPILVFDGRHLPAKELTEKRRRESRKECQRKAKELLREGMDFYQNQINLQILI